MRSRIGEEAAKRAKRTLRHYFVMLLQINDLPVEQDTLAEIDDIVEDIITAARES